MADLLIDMSKLDALVAALYQITREFASVKPVSKDLGEAVGQYDGSQHDGLTGNIAAFASRWDIHRSEIQSTLGAVSAAVKAIHGTFTEVDHDLAVALIQGT